MTTETKKTSFTKNLAKQNKLPVYLYNAKDKEHGDCWYYIELEKNKEQQFKKAVEKGSEFKITDYGRILTSGWGKNPPQKTINFLKELGIIK